MDNPCGAHESGQGASRASANSGRGEILRPLHEGRISDFVFPGQKPDRPLSNIALVMLMRRMGVDQFTVHGFRSSVRDWVGDATRFPGELAKRVLAHRVGDETERAFRRSDALDRRRQLMEAWSEFVVKSWFATAMQRANLSPLRAVRIADSTCSRFGCYI